MTHLLELEEVEIVNSHILLVKIESTCIEATHKLPHILESRLNLRDIDSAVQLEHSIGLQEELVQIRAH